MPYSHMSLGLTICYKSLSVPVQALGTRVEEAVTSLMRRWCADTRRGSATYLHHSIPGWPDFWMTVISCLGEVSCSCSGDAAGISTSAGGEHTSASTRAEGDEWGVRKPLLSCLAQRVRLNRQRWILRQYMGSSAAELPHCIPRR